jgi:hypothetical protein
MGQLFFKKPLQDAIREGRKQTTIRRWDRPQLKSGQTAYAPGVGWLAIRNVERVELEGLCDEDARADGIDTAALLKTLLESFYPDHATDGKGWFRVRFHLEKVAPPRRKKPSEGPVELFEPVPFDSARVISRPIHPDSAPPPRRPLS